ncbi:MAG: hypothetical protein ACRDRJ_12735 [Streptosporangiaceae bacterium]
MTQPAAPGHPGPVQVSEPAARALAARYLRRHAAGFYPVTRGPESGWQDPAPGEAAGCGPGWSPANAWDHEELPRIEDIVLDAVECGALILPPGMFLYLITIAGDPHAYVWQVGWNGTGFCLCSPHFGQVRHLGGGNCGARAITAIIGEAAAVANTLLAAAGQAEPAAGTVSRPAALPAPAPGGPAYVLTPGSLARALAALDLRPPGGSCTQAAGALLDLLRRAEAHCRCCTDNECECAGTALRAG